MAKQPIVVVLLLTDQRAESHKARDNARLAVAARGFGVPASNRVGLGAQPRVSYR